MLSQVARRELAPDGIVVSIVYPSVTATEFHQSLAAGARVGDPWAVRAHSAESVAEAIVGVIQSGEEEIMLTSGWDQGAANRHDTGQPQ
jgi:short-subunit dehydrogenase